MWWSCGDAARTYAVLGFSAPTDAALRRSWYAGLDPDRVRGSRIALTAIAEVAAAELPTLCGRLAHLGDDVRTALVARLSDHPVWPRVLMPGSGALALDQLDDPRIRVVAIARVPSPEARTALGTLWQHGGANADDDEAPWRRVHADLLALGLATRALEAWELVPELQRPATCRVVAMLGATERVERWIAETDDRTALEMMTSIATVHAPPVSWHAALREEAEAAEADYQTGVLTSGERQWRQWAALACDREAQGRAIAVAITSAHAAARAFGAALGQPPPPPTTDSRKRVTSSVERVARGGDLSATLGMIARAGHRGELALVREAIDRLETCRGPLDAIADRSVVAALAHYPGRARELLARVPLDDFPRAVAMTCAALARDGHAEDARRYATALLARPPGEVDRDSLDLVARVVLDAAGHARLSGVVDAALVGLPGKTLDDARRWLATPVDYASMS